ncbi:MAG: hypothetical protein KGN16_22650 [Burkholderiales bacterium]|nr:hypothetical protein [Burkholderiales bacterium]
MILIVSSANDVHALCVAQELARRGARYEVVDSTRLSMEGRVSHAIGAGRSSIEWTNVRGESVDLGEARAVWHRRRYMPVAPALPDADDEAFLKREWDELFSGLFASMDCPFVNAPQAQRAAVKPLQLHWASRLGLRFPDTLITNDPEQARRFVDRHGSRVIHKVLSPPYHRWMGTARWRDEDRAHLDELVLAPTIFQEMVTDCRELRVTLIGNELYAAEFRPRDGLIDGRLESFEGYRRHDLPAAVGRQLKALAARLGLVFCTIDLKLTNEGEYVFLELNPQGQFLYIEILTGMPLSRAFAELLIDVADGADPLADARAAAALTRAPARAATRELAPAV